MVGNLNFYAIARYNQETTMLFGSSVGSNCKEGNNFGR